MSEFNPSSVRILKAELSTHSGDVLADLSRGFITGFTFNQSMSTTSWSGVLDIFDSAGLIDNAPLRGEEKLELEILGADNQHKMRVKARVYKITDITPTNNIKGVVYKMHLLSETTFNATKHIITQSNHMPVNEVAKNIFNNRFTPLERESTTRFKNNSTASMPYQVKRWKFEDKNLERSFYIQPSKKTTTLIIPRLSPQEAMYFLASRAYNEETPSQTFRFFETFENYYFCTDEFFIQNAIAEETIQEMHYSPTENLQNGAPNPESVLGRIDNIQIMNKGIDSGKDIQSGAYRSRVVELDLIRRKVNIKSFNYDTDAAYIDMSGNTRNVADNPHTTEFKNEFFTRNNAKQTVLFKNYTQNGDSPTTLPADRKLAEILQNRLSYYHHLNNTAISASLKGRLDLRPGMLIHLQMPRLSSSEFNTLHSNLSGRYLIQNVVHSMKKDDTLNTGLRLVKFDWSGTNV